MSRTTIVIAVAILIDVLGGCRGISQDILEEATTISEEFLIGPEDVLEIVVWRNEDLTREVIVRPDGMISFPLLEDIKASGLSSEGLAKEIADRLKNFMETPTVSVNVKEVNSYSIYVLGEVAQPGKLSLKSYATVLHSIALAGGFTPFAARNDMQVIRTKINGKGQPIEIHIPLRYDDLIKGTSEPGNIVLRSGDVVVVP